MYNYDLLVDDKVTNKLLIIPKTKTTTIDMDRLISYKKNVLVNIDIMKRSKFHDNETLKVSYKLEWDKYVSLKNPKKP
jgi:hypothetical protein